MKKLFTVLGIAAVAVMANAQTAIAAWNFDNSSTAASSGAGTITLVGGVAENIQTGTTACNCAFVGGNPSSGKAYTTKNYPAQGANSGSAGIQISASTVGYKTISASVDVYGSNTASKYVQMQYTTDGSTFINVGSPTAIPTAVSASNPNTVTVSWVTLSNTFPSTADNNSAFAIRVVSVFDPANNATYTAVNNAGAGTTQPSSYAPAGALRFDNISITAGTLGTSEASLLKHSLIKNTVVDSELTFATKSSVQIFDANGHLVRTADVKENDKLNVSGLAKGVYIVKGIANGEKSIQKFIKK